MIVLFFLSPSFRAHSSHVTRVVFSLNDRYLFSTGGGDQTLIQVFLVLSSSLYQFPMFSVSYSLFSGACAKYSVLLLFLPMWKDFRPHNSFQIVLSGSCSRILFDSCTLSSIHMSRCARRRRNENRCRTKHGERSKYT